MNHVIFDTEMTCWFSKIKRDDNKNLFVDDFGQRMYLNQKEAEIIEIGAIKLDDNFNIIDTFQRFVKPLYNYKLTKACQKLTKITQTDVDNADSFFFVLSDFIEWIGENTQLYYWSKNDNHQIFAEAKRQDCDVALYKSIFNNGIDIQNLYTKFYEFSVLNNSKQLKKAYSLRHAINILCLPVGQFHRAINDAYMQAQILIALTKKHNSHMHLTQAV